MTDFKDSVFNCTRSRGRLSSAFQWQPRTENATTNASSAADTQCYNGSHTMDHTRGHVCIYL